MFTELKHFLKTHFQRSGNGLMQLILLNGLVFVGLLLVKTGLVLAGYEHLYPLLFSYLSLPANWSVFLHQPWSLFTYFWVHEGFFDVIWQSLFLYSFGQLLLHSLTSINLIVVYILSGLGGGACFLLLANLAPGFQGSHTSLVGSSASLYAIMTGTAILLPHFYFQLLLIGRIKSKYIVGALLILAWFELSQRQLVGVAKLSGAMIGYLYIYFLPHLRKIHQIWSHLFKGIRKNPALQVTYKNDIRATKEEAIQENKTNIDQILDKVGALGYGSLTKEEKRQLFEAGR